MKLNMYFLLDDCKQLALEGNMVDGPELAECTRPLICDELPDKLDPGIIYIIDANRLPKAHQIFRAKQSVRKSTSNQATASPSILCHGKPPSKWLRSKANVLFSPETIPLTALVNDVIGLFAHYAQWESSLQEVVDEKLPLAELARRSMHLLGNPTFAQSSSFRILFCELPGSVDEDERLAAYMRDFFLPTSEGDNLAIRDSVLTVISADEEYVHAVDAVGPTIYSGNPFEFRSLFYNCRVKGAPVARVLVEEVINPLHDRDYTLISVIGDYLVKGQFDSDLNAFDLPSDYEPVMRSLLEHRLAPVERIETLLNNMGWAMHDEYMVFLVSAGAIVSEHANALFQISLNLTQLQSHMHFLIHANRSVFVCNLTKAGRKRADTIAALTPVLRDQLAKASFSTTYHDFKELYYYYDQALATERAGSRTDPTYWLYRFEDYAFEIMVDRCLRRSIPEALFPPGLMELIAHDEAKGTHYVGLLKSYLDNDRNIARTAREAFVHRNTVLYQIGRIEEIAHLDLDDANKRAVLQIALHAYERDNVKASK